jgi:flavin reductase (DIM6/NTAB) family NADH-FMN oxidoreductase RutF
VIKKSTSELKDGEIYKLLAGLVVPRPIAFVSSLSADGVPNLAPFSFFTVLNDVPPVIGISVGLRYGKSKKDTVNNIRTTGEFVVNVVSEEIAEQMNIASLDWQPEVDEFKAAGLEPVSDNLQVRVPRVRQSPAQFECRLHSLTDFPRYTFVAGEIVGFHLREDIVDPRMHIDYDGLRVVGRLAGAQYCRVRERFSIERNADSPEARKAGGGG